MAADEDVRVTPVVTRFDECVPQRITPVPFRIDARRRGDEAAPRACCDEVAADPRDPTPAENAVGRRRDALITATTVTADTSAFFVWIDCKSITVPQKLPAPSAGVALSRTSGASGAAAGGRQHYARISPRRSPERSQMSRT